MRARSGGSRHALESCTLQLQSWSPFKKPKPTMTTTVTAVEPYPSYSKKPCHSDRSTAPDLTLDLSSLSLADEPPLPKKNRDRDRGLPLLARKRRRHGASRSVSGRSSVGGSAAHATCSDFPLAAGGTDSSGEMFMNGEGSWASDVSEVKATRKEGKEVGGAAAGGLVEREGSASVGFLGVGGLLMELQGNESGYGSETGYKGDAEFGYEDELDEEDDDGKLLFWGDRFGDEDAFSEMKSHPRFRRKKQDSKILAALKV